MSDYTTKHIDPEVNQRLGEIFALAYSFNLCPGEVQMLAATEFKKYLWLFTLSEIDAFRMWVKNNWFRKMQILSSELHEQLMVLQDTRYSEWFKAEEKQHTQKEIRDYSV